MSLFLSGDVMLGRGIDQILLHPSQPQLHEPHVDSALDYVHLAEEAGRIPRHVDPAYVGGDVLAVLHDRKPAALFINLETAITRGSKPWPKGINYRMHPANVGCLTAAQIDCCVLANNHVLEGQDGLLETMATLRSEQEFARPGRPAGGRGGRTSGVAARQRPKIAGLRSGFDDSGVPRDWAATDRRAGVNLLPTCRCKPRRPLRKQRGLPVSRGCVGRVAALGQQLGLDLPHAQRTFAHALVDGGQSCTGIHRIMQRASNSTVRA